MFDKRVQLLTGALPRVSRIAILRLPGEQNDFVVRDLTRAAVGLGLKTDVIEVQEPGDFPIAFPARSPRKGSGGDDGAGTVFPSACTDDGRARLEAQASKLFGRANGRGRGQYS
jgi:hypothetical protein